MTPTEAGLSASATAVAILEAGASNDPPTANAQRVELTRGDERTNAGVVYAKARGALGHRVHARVHVDSVSEV